MSPIGSVFRRVRAVRLSSIVTTTALAVAGLAAGVFLTSSPGTYRLNAVFPSAQGLFAGAPVQLLGVRVGTVTDVEYSGGAVDVAMQISGSRVLPADARAALITPLLLGQPNIELSPG
jgi:phospholipid/cholesterol/gamma-HCH transport system substrate-binding protein